MMPRIVGDDWVWIRPDGGPWERAWFAGMRGTTLAKVIAHYHETGSLDLAVDNYNTTGPNANLGDFHAVFERYERGRIIEMCASMKKGFDPYRAAIINDGMLDAPIALNINADGHFDPWTIPNGYHRMSICAVLGIPFRARIEARAPEWEELRVDLYGRWNRKYLYTPIPHPDFGDWEIGHGDSARFNVISDYIFEHNLGANVLDAGCHLGYQLWRLIESGTVRTGRAFDCDKMPLRVAELLLGFHGIKPDHSDVLVWLEKNQGERFSCVIATALLYHLLEIYSQDAFAAAVRGFCDIAPVFVFDDSPPNESWPDYAASHTLSELVEAIMNRTPEKIGDDAEFGRAIYILNMEEKRNDSTG